LLTDASSAGPRNWIISTDGMKGPWIFWMMMMMTTTREMRIGDSEIFSNFFCW
jgi:hypothetical protein